MPSENSESTEDRLRALEDTALKLTTEALLENRLRSLEVKLAELNDRPRLEDKIRAQEDTTLVIRTGLRFAWAIAGVLGISGVFGAIHLNQLGKSVDQLGRDVGTLRQAADKLRDDLSGNDTTMLEKKAGEVLRGKVPTAIGVSPNNRNRGSSPSGEQPATCEEGRVVWAVRLDGTPPKGITVDCAPLTLLPAAEKVH